MSTPPFRRILVANRGEIAVRICRSLRAMGIETVAVHSDVDGSAPHVLAADRAFNLGGRDASSSYLQVPQLLDAGCVSECDAVHPGYGFLSEDPDFARALSAVGMEFIGPDADSMEILGSKQRAKQAAKDAEVPVVPGFDRDTGDDAQMLDEARRVGFPLLIKASAGGGGKGMRLVRAEAEFLEAIAACRRESQAAFHSREMLLEKYLEPARHIEIQVLGDHHGNVVALNERECSVQRRHQKIIEEAPSPIVDTELRVQMSEAAVRLAKQVGYQNAGTVEFLVDARGSFYFLEMNTRLQVEHPVTECTTGLDLVQLQVLVAGGAKLPDLLRGRDLTPRGHAIEVRVYAEDPAQGYLPAAGVIQRVVEPCGPGVRVDSGVVSGTEIGVQFDPMISKIIVHGMDRENARQRLLAALRETAYLGISTNLDFLCRVLEQPGFIAGELSTGFLDANPELARASEPAPDLAYLAAALCGSLTPSVGRKPVAAGDAGPGTLPDVWDEGSGLRLWGQA